MNTIINEKAHELHDLAKSIFDNSIALAAHDKGQEIIEEKIDLLKYGLQKEIVEERCPESGKPKHTNDLARKSELTMREQAHAPLRMLKADRLSHIETTKNLQALIEFQKRQFQIGEKMLEFLANQN
jgi:hypothetical protein